MDFDLSTNLVLFKDKWWWTFLWVLFSSLAVHFVVALLSFKNLHKHKQARWYSLCVVLMGVIMPLTGGILTSAVIAGVFHSLTWTMNGYFAMILGSGQTAVVVFVSASHFLLTL